MEENSKSADNFPGAIPAAAGQNPGAALASALIPGLGQLITGEKIKAYVFFALDVLWIWAFFPPFRLPRFYAAWIGLIFVGLAIVVTASCQALRSHTCNRRPTSYIWLVACLPIAVLALSGYHVVLLRTAGFRAFRVISGSMAPTVPRNDVVMADLRVYRGKKPADGDIIVLKSPEHRGVVLIKRLMASGGETIQSQDGRVQRNGLSLSEPYVEHTGWAPQQLMTFGPVKVPPHKFFVMGDDRDISLDSRMPEFGLIDDTSILGKALYVITPGKDRYGERLYY